jgi:predicted O-methyltransferase YrrM
MSTAETWRMPEATAWGRRCNENPGALTYGRQLHELVRGHRYTRALEIGAAWGVSTMAILTAQDDGHLTSVDIDPGVKAGAEVEANGFSARWRFVLRDSRDFWRENRETFDLIYVDGDHAFQPARTDLFRAWEALEPGGLLVIDDVVHPKNLTGEYGVAIAAWQLVAELGITEVRSTGRLVAIPKP